MSYQAVNKRDVDTSSVCKIHYTHIQTGRKTLKYTGRLTHILTDIY